MTKDDHDTINLENKLPKHIELAELKTANHLLNDRAGLDSAWQKDGYWFFKGVIDTDALTDIREHIISYLKEQGLIDAGVDGNCYNGSGFENKGLTVDHLTRLLHFNRIDLDKKFTQHPAVHAFIKNLLGDEPFWLPQTDFRAVPPMSDPDKSRLTYPHQDGFYTPGIDMKTCWLPLDSIDPEVGGCAWLEGRHNGPVLHDPDNAPTYFIREVPASGWKTSSFEPGDIVIFHKHLPHSGLTNITADRFRLSFDIRVVAAARNTASVGEIVRISETAVTINNRDTGEEQSFRITQDTFVKDNRALRKTGSQITADFAKGDTVLVGAKANREATALSPVH